MRVEGEVKEYYRVLWVETWEPAANIPSYLIDEYQSNKQSKDAKGDTSAHAASPEDSESSSTEGGPGYKTGRKEADKVAEAEKSDPSATPPDDSSRASIIEHETLPPSKPGSASPLSPIFRGPSLSAPCTSANLKRRRSKSKNDVSPSKRVHVSGSQDK
jgi:hypothetical protein